VAGLVQAHGTRKIPKPAARRSAPQSPPSRFLATSTMRRPSQGSGQGDGQFNAATTLPRRHPIFRVRRPSACAGVWRPDGPFVADPQAAEQ